MRLIFLWGDLLDNGLIRIPNISGLNFKLLDLKNSRRLSYLLNLTLSVVRAHLSVSFQKCEVFSIPETVNVLFSLLRNLIIPLF